MTTRDALVTTEGFEAYISRPEHVNRLYELMDGEIIEKTMPTDEHGIITYLYSGEFFVYFRENPIGRVTIEARVRPTDDVHNDRLPDISVILGGKPVVRQGPVNFIPEICIEIKSPDDSLKKLREKAHFYIANGAKYVLITLPAKRAIELYAAEGEDQLLTGDDELTFGDLLPDFSVPISRFFPEISE